MGSSTRPRHQRNKRPRGPQVATLTSPERSQRLCLQRLRNLFAAPPSIAQLDILAAKSPQF